MSDVETGQGSGGRPATTPMMAAGGQTRADARLTAAFAGAIDWGTELEFEPERVDFISVAGEHFVIDFSRELGRGGEAVVALALDDAGNEYAAKVYSSLGDRREQNNHRAVLEFLSRMTRETETDYRSTHLMPLVAYGTVQARELGQSELTDYSVSLLPKCTCLGDDVVSDEMLKQRIIPGVAEALKTLHEHGIVHRDVKPSNIYEYNGVVVLGDYGISSVLDKRRQMKDTRSNRGTEGYWLPCGYVEPRGDWYSLGYAIWTMYNGNVHPHQNQIDSGNMAEIWAGKRIVPFVPKRPEDAGLGDLVYGLTMASPDLRLGYDDVQRWIADPIGFRFQDPSMALGERWSRPYKFRSGAYPDGSSLAEALSQDWRGAMEHLFDSEELVGHFKRVGENEISTRLQSIVREDAGRNQDFGVAKAIFFISGSDHRMSWKGEDVSMASLVLAFSSEKIGALARFDGLFRCGFLSWAIEEAADARFMGSLATIRAIEDVADSEPVFARLLFQHLFAGGGVSPYAVCENMDDVATVALSKPRGFYFIAESAKSAESLMAAMAPAYAEAGKLDVLIDAAHQKDSDVLHRAARLLALMDAVGSGCKKAREFARTYGPDAPWLWVAEHAESYTADKAASGGEDAARALSSIRAFVPVDSDSVAELRRKGDEARHYASTIAEGMDVSPMAKHLGVKTEACVHAQDHDALFCAEFYGRRVPRGFVRRLLQTLKKDASWPEAAIVSRQAREDLTYLEEFSSACSDASSSLERIVARSGSRSKAIARLVFDVVVAVGLAVLGAATGGVVVPLVGASLSVFFHSEFVLQAAIWFTQLTVAASVAFFAFDAVFAFSGSRVSVVAARESKKLNTASESVSDKASDFAAGQGELFERLRDVQANDPCVTGDAYAAVTSARAMARSSAVPGRSKVYKAGWHVSSILGALSVLAIVAALVLPIFELPAGIVLGVLFVLVAAAYAFVCHSYEGVYTSFGWLGVVVGLVIGVVAAAAIAAALIMLVLSLLAAIAAVVIAIAILIGFFSS